MAESSTATAAHAAATQHLPSFVTQPGETDVLMIVMAVILLVAVVGFGVFFFRLHSLPEQMAHKSHKLQFEIVAVMGLISLFTHQHIFWIAGLLLAMIDLPDFTTPLRRIAGSAERLAGLQPGEGDAEVPDASVTPAEHAGNAPGAPHAGDPVVALPPKSKERVHA